MLKRVSRHISSKNHQQLHRSENKVLESFICCVFLFSRILSVSGDTLLPCEFPAIYSFGYSNSDTGSSSPAFTLFPAANAADRARDGGPIMDFPGLGSFLTFHLSCLTYKHENIIYKWQMSLSLSLDAVLSFLMCRLKFNQFKARRKF